MNVVRREVKMPVISPGPYTKTLIIGEEAKKNACKFFSEEFSSKKGLVVCDENTEFIAGRDFPISAIFEGGPVATDITETPPRSGFRAIRHAVAAVPDRSAI